MGFNPVDLAFGYMDALQSANERLKAENTKLQDQLEEQKCFAADLEKDVRALRELVRDMWEYVYIGTAQDGQRLHDRTRELGIEVAE